MIFVCKTNKKLLKTLRKYKAYSVEGRNTTARPVRTSLATVCRGAKFSHRRFFFFFHHCMGFV